MTNIAILSCSLRPVSHSRALATAAATIVREAGHSADLLDLREYGVPWFDDDRAFADPCYAPLHAAIAAADGVVIASPVYNWGLSSVAKNVIELTGATGEQGRRSAWFDKLVTFLCAGGLPHSYTAYGATALALMLDFKCIVNPHAVYATERDWSAAGEPDAALLARLRRVLAIKLELAEKLRGRSYRSEWEV